MSTENNIDNALLDQVCRGIQDLLNIDDKNTDSEIQKLTAKLNKAEQRAFIDQWAHLYYFDYPSEYRTDEFFIKGFFLDKLE